MSDVVETGAINHPHVQWIKAYQGAMASGDVAAGTTYFAPDVTYSVPGNNLLSGEFHGPEQVMEYFGKLMQLTGGTYRITHMQWLVNGDQVLLATVNQATIGNRSLTWDEGILFEFKNGKKQRIVLFQADQDAVDAFYGQG